MFNALTLILTWYEREYLRQYDCAVLLVVEVPRGGDVGGAAGEQHRVRHRVQGQEDAAAHRLSFKGMGWDGGGGQ